MSNTNEIDVIEKVVTFFKSFSWRKLLTFSFFIFLAAAFWLMQVYRQKFEITHTIPIKYINVPDSLIFDTNLPDKLTVRLKDDGIILARYDLTKGKDSLIIDIREKINKNESHIIQGPALEDMIRSKLFVSSMLLSYSPNQIDCVYEVLSKKPISVQYNAQIDVASGYIFNGEFSFSPDTIWAYGAQSVLDTLRVAQTVRDTLLNLTSIQNLEIDLCPISGVKFVPNQVKINAPIDKFAQKEVEVHIECINLPKDLKIKFFPSSVKVPFYVGLSRYDHITDAEFKVIVDYNQIGVLDSRLSTVMVKVSKSPSYIKLKNTIPSEVEFMVEQD